MSKLLKSLCAGALLMLGAASCSATPDEPPPGVQRQALSRCFSDADCAYSTGGDITIGEHCGMDFMCHTYAEDPTCGLWEGNTSTSCLFYPGDCRPGHCASPATCNDSTGFCALPGDGDGCAPYAYADPCPGECEDDNDCTVNYICEATIFGGVCG
jgi:hypothetical protein